jgi:hypothetical protein
MMFDYIVHQENLCSESFPGFQHVMSAITKVINVIWSKGLNHRWFKTLLRELGSECSAL